MIELRNYIDGQWQTPDILLDGWVCDANDGRELFQQRSSSYEQLDRSLETAERVHDSGIWRDMSFACRIDILDKIYFVSAETGIVIDPSNGFKNSA